MESILKSENELLKSNELIKKKYDEFEIIMLIYKKALNNTVEKFTNLKQLLNEHYKYEVITNITSRIKSPESIAGKMKKKKIEINYENMVQNINDIAGVRIICNYKEDIYKIRNAIEEIDKHLRTRIRVIIWKQWKKPQRKEKALKQLGVKPDIAYNLAHTGKGYQLVAKTDWLKFAINNDRLRKRGLIFLSDQYAKVHVEI